MSKESIKKIWDLKKGKFYSVNKPIDIDITSEKGWIFIESDGCNVCVIGNTYKEAFEHFFFDIIYFYEHYKNMSENNLCGDALKWKEYYDNLLTEISEEEIDKENELYKLFEEDV